VPQSTLYSRQKRSIEHNPEQAKAEDAKETRSFEVKFGLVKNLKRSANAEKQRKLLEMIKK
jgi:hypothetical protein